MSQLPDPWHANLLTKSPEDDKEKANLKDKEKPVGIITNNTNSSLSVKEKFKKKLHSSGKSINSDNLRMDSDTSDDERMVICEEETSSGKYFMRTFF